MFSNPTGTVEKGKYTLNVEFSHSDKHNRAKPTGISKIFELEEEQFWESPAMKLHKYEGSKNKIWNEIDTAM